jgi:hypothetical protein
LLGRGDTAVDDLRRIDLRPALPIRYPWTMGKDGRWPPSTIKRITGCAYGFRDADPPFFRLIAAPARPSNSHQE